MRIPVRHIFPFIFFAFYNYSFAQENITTSNILTSALNSRSLELHNRELDFLKNTNHDLPWINKMEFRTETDELDWERQEYLFRMSLNSTEEREAQKKMHQKNIQLSEIKKDEILEQELIEIYFLIVKYHYLEKELSIYENIKKTAEDQLNVFQKSALAAGTNNLNNILDSEEKLHKIELKLFELKNEILFIQSRLFMIKNQKIDFSTWVDIQTIEETILKKNTTPENSPNVTRRKTEIEKIHSEHESESASSERILDFVQLKYSGRDNLSIGQEFSFGMGFNIPYKNKDNLDLNELALEKIKKENNLELYILRKNEQKTNLENKLNNLIKEYNFISTQLNDSQIEYSIANYKSNPGANPITLLKIEGIKSRNALQENQIKKELYFTYLELLALSGKLIERPLRNYLSKNLEEIN